MEFGTNQLSNMFGARSELASVMEFGFKLTAPETISRSRDVCWPKFKWFT